MLIFLKRHFKTSLWNFYVKDDVTKKIYIMYLNYLG